MASDWDQGAEMAEHAQLRIDTGLAIYFCDPRSPCGQGGVRAVGAVDLELGPPGVRTGFGRVGWHSSGRPKGPDSRAELSLSVVECR